MGNPILCDERGRRRRPRRRQGEATPVRGGRGTWAAETVDRDRDRGLCVVGSWIYKSNCRVMSVALYSPKWCSFWATGVCSDSA